MKLILFVIIISLFLASCSKKQTETGYVKNISGLEWNIWLDTKAEWINDSLYLPPIDIEKIPVNEPTCGWDSLFLQSAQKTILPATVEEYFWGQNGNHYGISGNYKGVSWFYTTLTVPQSAEGKRLSLHFESVRMRAEIYINKQLVGYDMIDGTPFDVDITKFVKYGEDNQLAVRITDPNGNFNWRDSRKFTWGKYRTIISHGFGGITGRVFLHTTDPVYIEDVYIKNKPEITSTDVEVIINNIENKNTEGQIVYEVYEKENPATIILTESRDAKIKPGKQIQEFTITMNDAKLWSPNDPNLYMLKVKWEGSHSTHHEVEKTFGFRWFDVVETDDDRYFVLNNKRIVLRTSISWGFWPVNGMFPTEQLAEKQIAAAKSLGLNMLNFHRTIGATIVLDEADKQGLLYYAEPGGYKTASDDFTQKWAQEKLLRMVKRDRSHPALVIFNLQNEIGRDPGAFDKETISKAHQLDETRLITYTSTNFSHGFYDNTCPYDTAEIKMHVLPYEPEIRYFGHWDQHHAGGPGCYPDDLYKSPTEYRGYTANKQEIVFWGEEGAIGTPARFALINHTISKNGKTGWDGQQYIETYNAYNEFLTGKGFYDYFPDMQTLLISMGNVSHYYQGRMIENIRMNNLVDGYVVNGWESEKIENHSGIVDIYRNIKGDSKIMAYYNQPVYIAVKVKNKVVELGDTSVVDFYLINETGINGNCELQVTSSDSSGTVLEKIFPVDIAGGFNYGQLLTTDLSVVPSTAGYCNVNAKLMQNNKTVAEGKDEIFTVNTKTPMVTDTIAYCDDSTHSVEEMLSIAGIENTKLYPNGQLSQGKNANRFADAKPTEKALVIGFDPPKKISRNQNAIFDWIADGNTLIIIKNAEKWADYLNLNEVVDYRGYVTIGKVWFGGNLFVKNHPLFNDLPVNCAFNWEYQSFALYSRKRLGLRLKGEECVVGAQCEHKPELFTAVGIIPVGRGKIIISALDLEKALKSEEQSPAVAKKILRNFINYAINQ